MKRINKQKEIVSLFPSYVIETIEKDKFLNATRIDWKQKWLGPTQYIDRAKYGDFEDDSGQIYYGEDNYKRPFIFIKIKVDDNTNVLISIFQRYTDSEMYVAIEPTQKMCNFFKGEVRLNSHLQKLQDLFLTFQYN